MRDLCVGAGAQHRIGEAGSVPCYADDNAYPGGHAGTNCTSNERNLLRECNLL